MKERLLFISIIFIHLLINISAKYLQAQDDSKFITTELLGRPSDSSVTVNALARTDLNVYIEYGIESFNYSHQSNIYFFAANEPIEIIVDKLQSDTQYFYRLSYKQVDEPGFYSGDEHSFHTHRNKGSAFSFVVQADPHLDEQSNPDLYVLTLQNTLEDRPDFLIDLGDNFMSDKIPEFYPGASVDYEKIVERHLLHRNYYDDICHSIPLFLALGNHEGELGWQMDGTSENMAVWATTARKLYYPNPIPNHFYSGNTIEDTFSGLPENYYSFEWGDALFIVLDPYRYTMIKPGKDGDNWEWTLGEDQYNWFRQTLEGSTASYKFVFCHQLIGGKDTEARGGAEYVQYYEMGGLNEDGSYEFDQYRPGWYKPIHPLMVENNVSIFFHGHDHFFAKQDADGVIYQLVPQPSHPNYKRAGQAEEYGYISGDILPNSGHLRVSVSESSATVDYVRAYLPADEDEQKGRINGVVDFSYTLEPVLTELKTKKDNSMGPEYFSLKQNYPNPFNPSTMIKYSIQKAELVQLKIFDVSGREICTLVDEMKSAGNHQIEFSDSQLYNMSPLPSGVYFYQLRVGINLQTKRMIFLK